MNIAATEKTPKVVYDASAGVLTISGKSIPENTLNFYQEVFAGDGARGFEILGNKQVSYDLEIKIPAGSKLANKILAANKIELSTGITQECQR
jgi:hypothetical protein